MSKEIKVGVIGCGAIGRQHIARLMNTIPETRVVAVADYYQPSAQAVAEQYGITCCATGEELIALPEVDAVLVTSADPSHAGYVLECIKAGKFVFCEKRWHRPHRNARRSSAQRLQAADGWCRSASCAVMTAAMLP